MPIDSKSQAYCAKIEEWLLVRAAMAGEPVIMQKLDELKCVLASPVYSRKSWSYTNDDGEICHRNNNAQITARKEAYWSRPVLVPVVQRTINAMEGMIWAGEPLVKLPASLEPAEKVLRNVSQEVTRDLVSMGRCGVWIDMAESTGTISEQTTPIPHFYEPGAIFFPRYEGDTLLEVRLYEFYDKQVSEFDWKVDKQIRRLFINKKGDYECQLYRDLAPYGEAIIPMIGGKPMKEIPFVFGGAEENSPKMGPTPMYCLSRMNLAHFRLDADDRDNLHYHGQALTVVATGMVADEFLENNGGVIDTGASGVNIVGQGDTITYSQIEATGAIGNKMEKDMENMIAAGAQLVKPTSDRTTLGAREMEFSSSTSVLRKVAYNQTAMMTDVVRFMCEFMNEAPVEYEMQPKFITDNVDAPMLQQVMQYVMTLGMPIDIAYDAIRKAGLTELTDEELKEKSEAQADTTTIPLTAEQAAAQAELDSNKETES